MAEKNQGLKRTFRTPCLGVVSECSGGEENGEVRWRRCTAAFIKGRENWEPTGVLLLIAAALPPSRHAAVQCNTTAVVFKRHSYRDS